MNQFSTEQLRQRFHENLNRCRGLIIESLKSQINPASGQDILRSVVVFLHASTEDLMRTILLQMYRRDPGLLLDHRPADMHKVGELWSQITSCDPATTVQQLILDEIQHALSDVSFGNTGRLAKELGRLKFPVETFDGHFSPLSEMMARRHKIVHYADRADSVGSEPEELLINEVENWMLEVEGFGYKLIGAYEGAAYSS